MPDASSVRPVPSFRLPGGHPSLPSTPTAFGQLLGAMKLYQECLVAYRNSGGLGEQWVALDRARVRLETIIEILGCQREVSVDAPEAEGGIARVIPQWYAELRHASQVDEQRESMRGTDGVVGEDEDMQE